jgi:hypothetical protein
VVVQKRFDSCEFLAELPSRSSSRRVEAAVLPAALFAASYPSRTTALVGLAVYVDPIQFH